MGRETPVEETTGKGGPAAEGGHESTTDDQRSSNTNEAVATSVPHCSEHPLPSPRSDTGQLDTSQTIERTMTVTLNVMEFWQAERKRLLDALSLANFPQDISCWPDLSLEAVGRAAWMKNYVKSFDPSVGAHKLAGEMYMTGGQGHESITGNQGVTEVLGGEMRSTAILRIAPTIEKCLARCVEKCGKRYKVHSALQLLAQTIGRDPASGAGSATVTSPDPSERPQQRKKGRLTMSDLHDVTTGPLQHSRFERFPSLVRRVRLVNDRCSALQAEGARVGGGKLSDREMAGRLMRADKNFGWLDRFHADDDWKEKAGERAGAREAVEAEEGSEVGARASDEPSASTSRDRGGKASSRQTSDIRAGSKTKSPIASKLSSRRPTRLEQERLEKLTDLGMTYEVVQDWFEALRLVDTQAQEVLDDFKRVTEGNTSVGQEEVHQRDDEGGGQSASLLAHSDGSEEEGEVRVQLKGMGAWHLVKHEDIDTSAKRENVAQAIREQAIKVVRQSLNEAAESIRRPGETRSGASLD